MAGCGSGPGGGDTEEERYERLVSLGPTITQNIYLLGREDLLVGVSSYCEALPGVESKEIAGDLVNANIEQVMKLSPDAVLVSGMISRGSVERLESLGINVVSFPEPGSFEELCSQFGKLGGLIGKEEKAAAIISGVKSEVDGIRSMAEGFPRKRVIAQIGADPLWVSPKNSFMNDIIEFSGGVNLGPEEGGRISIESVIKKNPEVILIVDMGIAGEQKRMWLNFPSVEAVKNEDIYLVDSFVFCSPTPELFVEAVKQAFEIFHGK